MSSPAVREERDPTVCRACDGEGWIGPHYASTGGYQCDRCDGTGSEPGVFGRDAHYIFGKRVDL